MTSRRDAIRAAFSVRPDETLSADNIPAAPSRVPAGSVQSLKSTFSAVERENEELRERLSTGNLAIEIDPSLVDPSPYPDRFEEQDLVPYEVFKASLAARGQEVPILVRVHPAKPNRYQCAYCHRRLRATRELGMKVRAIVRPMSDEDLATAQGVENSEREDLSFIDRAVFSKRLEDAGFDRSVVQAALSIDRAEASKLITIANLVPSSVVQAIGRAPRVGRGRWQALTEALKTEGAQGRVTAALNDERFRSLKTDARFLAVLAEATRSEPTPSPSTERNVTARDGRHIAQVKMGEKSVKLTISRASHAGFADFLLDQLPSLFDAYSRRQGSEDDTA